MLKIIQRFGKHCCCHLQGECVVVGPFWKSYIGQAVGCELDLMVLIGGAEEGCYPKGEEQLAPSNPTRHLLPALYKASKNNQPLHIRPEYGNCNICRNIGQFSTFDAAHPPKLKLHIKLFKMTIYRAWGNLKMYQIIKDIMCYLLL
jgi:hypothetical protein